MKGQRYVENNYDGVFMLKLQRVDCKTKKCGIKEKVRQRIVLMMFVCIKNTNRMAKKRVHR